MNEIENCKQKKYTSKSLQHNDIMVDDIPGIGAGPPPTVVR